MKPLLNLIILNLIAVSSFTQDGLRSICEDSTKEEIQKSLTYFSDKFSKDSTDYKSCYDAGMCYYKLGKYKEAKSYFSNLISLNSNYPGAYSNRGLINLLMKNTSEACIDFKQSIKKGHNPKAINGMTLKKWCKENCSSKSN